MHKYFLISCIIISSQTLLAPPPTEIYEYIPRSYIAAEEAITNQSQKDIDTNDQEQSDIEKKKNNFQQASNINKPNKESVGQSSTSLSTKKDQLDSESTVCTCDFCNEIYAKTKLQSIAVDATHKTNTKDWTFMVYIAADNDLRGFAARNIRQLAAIGSSEHVNIIVHLDIKVTGNQKVSRFYYIEKNRVLHLNLYDKNNIPMDSGNPQTLVTFCGESITNFPAKQYALILWNHGTGAINPSRGRVVNPSLLFNFNPSTQKLELDRSVGYLDYICDTNTDSRGICWDDSTGNYLTNEDLAYALNIIRGKFLAGNKFQIIGFDACLMSMIEVQSLMKDHASIMVSSQEVILGTGWNYLSTLYPLSTSTLTAKEFAYHMVASYDQAYNKITNDYTLSAIKLYRINAIEKNIDTVAKLLCELIKKDRSGKIRQSVIRSRDRRFCTHFDEPSYIDLYHFYQNILMNVGSSNSSDSNEIKNLRAQLTKQIKVGLNTINTSVVAYACGKNLHNAHGISIYFPRNYIHSSYRRNTFFKTNGWGELISICT